MILKTRAGLSAALLLMMLGTSQTASATGAVTSQATLSSQYTISPYRLRDISFEGTEAIPVGARILSVNCWVTDSNNAGGFTDRVVLITYFDGAEVGDARSIGGLSGQQQIGWTYGQSPVGTLVTAENQVTARVRRRFTASQQIHSCDALWNPPCDASNCSAPDFCHWDENTCVEDSAANSIVNFDFNTPDTTDINSPYTGTPWDVSLGTVRDDHVQIRYDRIDHHYFRWTGPLGTEVLPSLYNNYTEQTIEDGALIFDARGLNATYMETGRRMGASYLMTSPTGDYCSDGYHLLVDANGVELTKNCGTVIGSWSGSVDATFHEYRVTFQDGRHVVYMDGDFLFESLDSEYTAAGYVGISSYYSVSFFDNFRVLTIPEAE